MSTLQQGDDAAAAVAVAPRVTLDDVTAKVASMEYAVFGGRLTVCVITTANGFIVTGESSSVSIANFDHLLGREIARDQALSKLWAFEGYLLRERLHTAAEA